MNFLKRNPVFWGLCICLIVIFLGFTILILLESGKLSKARAQVASADGQIQSLMYANPTPTNRNVKAAETNVEELRERLQGIYEALQQGAQLNVSNDVSVI